MTLAPPHKGRISAAFRLLTLLVAVGVGIALSPQAQAASATGNASATVIKPLTIQRINNLIFGAMVAGASGGDVIMDTDGNRSATGTVVLVDSFIAPGAAVFRVRGETGTSVTITLPSSVTLNRVGGGGSMLSDNYISEPASPMSPFSGDEFVSVGATLHVGAAQNPGNYSGTFNVTVSY